MIRAGIQERLLDLRKPRASGDDPNYGQRSIVTAL